MWSPSNVDVDAIPDPPSQLADGAWRAVLDGRIVGYLYAYVAPTPGQPPALVEQWFMVVDVPLGNDTHGLFDPEDGWQLEPLDPSFDRGPMDEPNPPPECTEPKPAYRRVCTYSKPIQGTFRR
jgi:hypothetical protein